MITMDAKIVIDDNPLVFSEDSDLDGNANDCDICDFDADDDIDGDGVCGDIDNCVDTANSDQMIQMVMQKVMLMTQMMIMMDAKIVIDDNPLVFSEDSDLDGNANDCDICDFDADDDIDGDGVCGDIDNCVDTANSDQMNTDGDAEGDVCDTDDDNDDV